MHSYQITPLKRDSSSVANEVDASAAGRPQPVKVGRVEEGTTGQVQIIHLNLASSEDTNLQDALK